MGNIRIRGYFTFPQCHKSLNHSRAWIYECYKCVSETKDLETTPEKLSNLTYRVRTVLQTTDCINFLLRE